MPPRGFAQLGSTSASAVTLMAPKKKGSAPSEKGSGGKTPSEAQASRRKKTGGRTSQSHTCKDNCAWCRRPLTTRNPIDSERQKHPTLHRPSPHHPCTCCSGAWKKYRPEMSFKGMGEEVRTDSGHKKFMVCVGVFVCFRNGTPYEEVEGYEAFVNKETGTTITRRTSKDIMTQVVVSHFWPCDVLYETLGVSTPENLAKTDIDRFNKRCKGVFRDPEKDPEVLPPRVRPVLREMRIGSHKDELKNRGEDNAFEGESAAAWKAEQAATDISLQEVKDAKGKVIGHDIVRKVVQEGSDSEDGFVSGGIGKVRSLADDAPLADAGDEEGCTRSSKRLRGLAPASSAEPENPSGTRNRTSKRPTGETDLQESKPAKTKSVRMASPTDPAPDAKKKSKPATPKSAASSSVKKSPKDPLSQAHWKIKQDLERELQHTENCSSQGATLERHFNENGCLVLSANA